MTQEQYMQLMAQQQGQRAMMQQSSPANSFMGGLIDSAAFGLMPNDYIDPNNPSSAGQAQLGGMLGMIIPMLLAKYGIKTGASALAKSENALGRWIGAAESAATRTPEQLGRLDMLASILGGGVGGGLAMGPMGGLLGAAGMGAYSRFVGPGAAMGEKATYDFGKLFSGKPKPPKTPKDKAISKSTEIIQGKEAAQVKEAAKTAFKDPAKPDLDPIVDMMKGGFDDKQFAYLYDEAGEITNTITPRSLIKKAKEDPSGKITVSKVTKNPVKGETTPIASEKKETTWAELLDEFIAPAGQKGKYKYDGKTFEYDPAKVADMKEIKRAVQNGHITNFSKIRAILEDAHKMPDVSDKMPPRLMEAFQKPVTASAASKAVPEEIKAVYEVYIKKGLSHEEALAKAKSMNSDEFLMDKAFSQK